MWISTVGKCSCEYRSVCFIPSHDLCHFVLYDVERRSRDASATRKVLVGGELWTDGRLAVL